MPSQHGIRIQEAKTNSVHALSSLMGLGKRDLERKKKSLENKLVELEERAKKSPLNKQLQEEIKDLKKKIAK